MVNQWLSRAGIMGDGKIDYVRSFWDNGNALYLLRVVLTCVHSSKLIKQYI